MKVEHREQRQRRQSRGEPKGEIELEVERDWSQRGEGVK